MNEKGLILKTREHHGGYEHIHVVATWNFCMSTQRPRRVGWCEMITSDQLINAGRVEPDRQAVRRSG